MRFCLYNICSSINLSKIINIVVTTTELLQTIRVRVLFIKKYDCFITIFLDVHLVYNLSKIINKVSTSTELPRTIRIWVLFIEKYLYLKFVRKFQFEIYILRAVRWFDFRCTDVSYVYMSLLLWPTATRI